ncbi:MAG: hypothetical protein ACYS47_02660, partial [Planctomycetota bacterium]
ELDRYLFDESLPGLGAGAPAPVESSLAPARKTRDRTSSQRRVKVVTGKAKRKSVSKTARSKRLTKARR